MEITTVKMLLRTSWANPLSPACYCIISTISGSTTGEPTAAIFIELIIG
jgi:hypothetical protein